MKTLFLISVIGVISLMAAILIILVIGVAVPELQPILTPIIFTLGVLLVTCLLTSVIVPSD